MRTCKVGYCLTIGLACVLGMAQPYCLAQVAQDFHTETVEVQSEEGLPLETEVILVQAEPAGEEPKTAVTETVTNFQYTMTDSAQEENEKLKPIRIFCKVLDHQLRETLREDYSSPSFISEGCKGYWIPPNDVLIMLNVNFPVRVVERIESEKTFEESKPEDLWNLYEKQSTRREVELANPSLKVYTTVITDQNSPEKVAQLKKIVTDVIAKYGSRLKQEFPFDRLSIVVNGGSGRNSFAITRAPMGKKIVIENAKEAQAKELDHLKRILALKEEQVAAASEQLTRIQQQVDSGVAPVAEVDQAKEKLAERKIELEKMHQEMDQLKHRLDESAKAVPGKRVEMEGVAALQIEPRQDRVALKRIEGEGIVREALPVGVNMSAPNSTLIFQIKGEQVTDAETIQSGIQITAY